MTSDTSVPLARGDRRSIRLKGYDYSQPGAYFVTVVVRQRECLLGAIYEGEMRLSQMGRIVEDAWEWLARQYPYVDLDEWVVMPNHLHGIIVISEAPRGSGRGGSRAAPTSVSPSPLPTKRKPLGELVGAFKTVSTKRVNRLRGMPGVPLWQRNYYEHVIRNTADLDGVRAYIAANPVRWSEDAENPDYTPE